MRKISVVVFSALIISLLLAMQGICATPSVEQISEKAKIDWTNLVYIATGEGAMPSAKEEPNRARAYLKAKGYARMAAIANLLAAIEGTTISFEATGKDYMEEATIRQKIEGYVKNVQIASDRKETVEGDTIVIVEVRAPMFGQRGPGTVLLDKEIKQEAIPPTTTPGEVTVEANVKVSLKPDRQVTVNIPTPTPAASDKPYTSVIIDTTGYALQRCMSPKIRKSDGSEVWGSIKVDPDLVLERGIVSYSTTLASAKTNPRCGSNPLIIRAVGKAGGKFNSDPVISDQDSQLILAENSKSGFLDKLNVIIVEDGKL